MTVQQKAKPIRLILFDVDGVLTDGKILLHPDGSESMQFDIKDGTAIVWARRAGLTAGFLSARTSASTAQRAAQLGVTLVHQGVASKLDTFHHILSEQALDAANVAYMGDDLLDLPVLSQAGFSAAPADAVAGVKARVDWVSRSKGGHGAARELVEMILKAQGRWNALVESYTREAPRR